MDSLPGDLFKFVRTEAENSIWRSGSSPYLIVFEQILVDDRCDLPFMAERRYTTYCVPGLRPDEVRIGKAYCFTADFTQQIQVSAIPPADQYQIGLVSFVPLEDQRFHDLTHLAPNRRSSLLSSSSALGEFNNV